MLESLAKGRLFCYRFSTRTDYAVANRGFFDPRWYQAPPRNVNWRDGPLPGGRMIGTCWVGEML